MSSDAPRRALTNEQVVAATFQDHAFLEAHPGAGKTTVAAQRFGVQRFTQDILDPRAVLAISFTRSATRELRTRVARTWGPRALAWPHRIVTVDTIVYEMVEHLLVTGQLRWPEGHTTLDVRDGWAAVTKLDYTPWVSSLEVSGSSVRFLRWRSAKKESRPTHADFQRSIRDGLCTHEDVRAVLASALEVPDLAAIVKDRLRRTIKGLIVDEIFDANELDLALVELTCGAGVRTTVVGDPWQALYGFRGAKPEDVPALVGRAGIATLPLTRSFRWVTEEQRILAGDLRASRSVVLPRRQLDARVEVVLSCEWKPLWEASDMILPLAFSGGKGTLPEAAATLLLDHVTRGMFGLPAADVANAIGLLGLEEDEVQVLRSGLDAVVEALRLDRQDVLKHSYGLLAELVMAVSDKVFPRTHWQYEKRLELLQRRLRSNGGLIVGMTAHQAKGRQWSSVGMLLKDAEREHLSAGLQRDNEKHRQLYVAATRARSETFEV